MMETDRELLELAAKAVELEIKPAEVKNVTAKGDVRFIGYMTEPEQWPRGWFDPLNNDSDALRLAVKLNIAFFPPENNEGDFAVASIAEGVLSDDGDAWIQEWVKGGDKLAATRRAIVRAAAEIGRSMP